MTSEKVALVRQIIAAKRYMDLYEIVVGISRFNTAEASTQELTDDEQRTWQLSIHHLEFLSKYGESKPMVEENGRQWFAHPEEFNAWLRLGAPGISLIEIYTYLAAVPLQH